MPASGSNGAQGAPSQASGSASTSKNTFTDKKFIGAVEDEWILYSDDPQDYTIGPAIGFGASSIVYQATYHPKGTPSSPPQPPVPVALKVLDLDSLPPNSLALLQRETTLMSLSKHPNVLRVRGSWMDGHKLYIAMRLMNKGSAADVMRYGWPGGMEEEVVRCILRQALQGLNYLHINGFIHRDVKAANLLMDDDGTVLLGDLGVAANLAEDTYSPVAPTKPHSVSASAAVAERRSWNAEGDAKRVLFDHVMPPNVRPKIGKRKSFVGTPCWMAPEVIKGQQYDSAADIWSFGITAIELTQGRPPRSREAPSKVFMRTIQEDPPTLDRDNGVHKYSRALKEIIDSCLVKDPSKRPSAEQLLQTPFFKNAKKKSYLVHKILKDLPPLAQRQERRATSRHQTMRSIESWDFTTTVHSTTASFRRHRSGSEDSPTVEAVIELGETVSPSPRTHSRAVSFVDIAPPLKEEDELAAQEEEPSAEATTSQLPPSSSDPSLGEASDTEDTPSQGSSPPSSVNLAPVSDAKPKEEPMTPSQAIANSYSTSAMESTPKTSEDKSSAAAPHRPSLSPSSPSFWRRLKSSARRTASHRSTAADDERNEALTGSRSARRLTSPPSDK
ncbi:kinase-like protein [Schizophyllum commune Tattone D]|nr:kinase-like protein [Schizophyllum commune Tattone D]